MQVCLGGYGEPVSHEIPAPAGATLAKMRPADLMFVFEMMCRAHAETLPEYGK